MTSAFVQLVGNSFFKTLEISLHASLIIAVLLVIRPVIKRFLPPRWVYALWFIVVARLLLVEVPSLPEAASPPLQSSLAVVQSISREDYALPHAALISTVPGASGAWAMTWPETFAVIWLMGVAALLVHFGLGSFRWSRRLVKIPAIEAPEIGRLLEECREEMGVRQVRLVRLPGFASPSMTGLFHPTIILPEDFLERFSPEELRWILLHELAHLKRWDLPVQLLCQVLQAIHWFNPLVWLAFACFRRDRELACDALVLDQQVPKTTREYGHALIKVAETYPRSFLAPGFLGISEEKTDLQERVEKISRHRRPALGWIVSGAILCALLAVVFLTRQAAPIHRATAKIQIQNDVALAEVEVIQSSDVVVPAVKSLGLEKTWAKRFGSNESEWTNAEIMDHVSKILTVELVKPGAGIIYVTVQSDPPQEAADIANAIVDKYKATHFDKTVENITRLVSEANERRIADAESQVEAAADKLQKLRADTSHSPDPPAIEQAQFELERQNAQVNELRAGMRQEENDRIANSENDVLILARAY